MTLEENIARVAADAVAGIDDGDLELLGVVLAMRRELPWACDPILRRIGERAIRLGRSAGDVFNFFMEDSRVEAALSVLEHAVTEEQWRRAKGGAS